MEFINNFLNHDNCINLIEKILKTNDFELIKWKIKNINNEYFNIKCTIRFSSKSDEVTIVQFIMKNVTEIVFSSKDTNDMEIALYKIINDEQKWISHLYDIIQNDWLILEDLISKGYGLQKLTYLDYDHCRVALKTIARMHAFGFTYIQNCESSEFIDKLSDNDTPATWFNKSVDVLASILDSLIPNDKDIKKFVKEVFESLYNSLSSDKYPKTLCHNKLLQKHLMFRYSKHDKPLSCRLKNFQSISLSCPVFDIFIFLYANTTSDFLENHLFELTNFYYVELCKQLKNHELEPNEIFNKIDFEAICADMVICGRLNSFIQKMFEVVRKTEKFSKTENYIDFVVSNNTEDIYEELSTNKYKPMLLEIWKEIQEISIQRNISKELCIKLIKDSYQTNEINLKNFAFSAMSGKNGFLGFHRILQIEVDIDDNFKIFQFFVKFFPEEPGQLYFLNLIKGFEREAVIYREIFELMASLKISIDTVIPKCHMVCSNGLVLEFLEKYRMHPKSEMFDYNHVDIMFKSLAKLHAGSIILEEKLTKEDENPFIVGEKYRNIFFEFMYRDVKMVGGMPMGIILVNDLLLNLMDRKCLKEKLEILLNQLPYYTTASSKYRNVINHGDLWSSNIMFKYSTNNQPIHCRFVDFQFGRYLPQSHDVMCSLHQTTTVETRRKYKLELLTNYYTYFKQELQQHEINCDDVITFESFLDSCEEMKPFAMLQTARNFQFIMMSLEYEKEYLNDPKLQDRLNNGDVFDLISKNLRTEAYREIMRDTHVPLIEFLKTL